MSHVHLVLLWHMHQPLYRDAASGEYVLPWTRLHALKDYWGMVKVLEEFPNFHATFNLVPSLLAQIEEYASGQAKDHWQELAYAPADSLTREDQLEILDRAFQVNREITFPRWPRFGELYEWTRSAGRDAVIAQFGSRDWRDLQALSLLAWMDEEDLEHDAVVSALARKGREFSEEDKAQLRAAERKFLARIVPEYRRAADRGQIEISTTPFYHPILPLLCDTDVARIANPHTPLPQPAFRHPEDAREQLLRARQYHEKIFGASPRGLWPSEGSVSNQALEIAAEMGFEWFATDEGVLGRTRKIAFWRDPSGCPENAFELYAPWKIGLGEREMTGLFRDHYLSDLIGFVYSRVDAEAAAADLHRRIRLIADRASEGVPATVCIFLDGENAWEHYWKNGREFLRKLYGKVASDPRIRALTASEAIAADTQARTNEGIFPGSWINANFDIWIGHTEDVRAWEMLRDAREIYARALEYRLRGEKDAPSQEALARACESVLAAEGSDWCWWFGPEHSTASDPEFDALYRKHLTGIYAALGEQAPDSLAQPIKRVPEMARHEPPAAWLDIRTDGRETSYFEWLGAGTYSAARETGTMHGRVFLLGELRYGFSREALFLRLDPLPEAAAEFTNAEVRLTVWDDREHRIRLRLENGVPAGYTVESGGISLIHPETEVIAAFDKIAEIRVARSLFELKGRRSLLVNAAVWKGGLPVDRLPAQGYLEVRLGEENFAWDPE